MASVSAKGEALLPFAILAFLALYGFDFAISLHSSSSEPVTLFGTQISSIVHAGLDYGYWVAILGAVVLTVSIGIARRQAPRFVAITAVIAAACLGFAFAFASHPKRVEAKSAPNAPAQSESPSTQSSSQSKADATPAFDSSPYVQVLSITARRFEKDYDANRYSDSIVITPVFKNVGQKTITGLRGHLSVLDGFGTEVYGFNFRADDKLFPGHDSSRMSYSFEHNQFSDDDPYSKMAPLISGETAKYAARITQIAFSDGTVLPETK